MPSDDLERARKELTGRVMGRPGVSGTAVGLRHGKPCLVVYLNRGEGARKPDIPSRVRGFPVVVEETGPFRSL